MEQNPENPKKIRNDYSPELVSGKPTEHQIIKEFSVLWNFLLDGYGVPMQIRRYLFAVWTLTKDGKRFAISDPMLAAQLGGTCKNYVCNLRKQYKAWLNSENDNGIRNYPFVSVIEHSYDKKQRQQKPTEYEFSIEFSDLLSFLAPLVRKHHLYKSNWILAIKETVSENRNGRLVDFGYWTSRKRKRERSADNILGTYLLNFKRITGKIMEFVRQQGFDADETKNTLHALLPRFIEQSYDELILKESTQKIEPSENDFNGFINLALRYVVERETKPDTVIEKKFSFATGENKNVLRGDERQSSANESRGTNNTEKPLVPLDELTNAVRDMPRKRTETALDSERIEFLKRRKKRE